MHQNPKQGIFYPSESEVSVEDFRITNMVPFDSQGRSLLLPTPYSYSLSKIVFQSSDQVGIFFTQMNVVHRGSKGKGLAV